MGNLGDGDLWVANGVNLVLGQDFRVFGLEDAFGHLIQDFIFAHLAPKHRLGDMPGAEAVEFGLTIKRFQNPFLFLGKLVGRDNALNHYL